MPKFISANHAFPILAISRLDKVKADNFSISYSNEDTTAAQFHSSRIKFAFETGSSESLDLLEAITVCDDPKIF